VAASTVSKLLDYVLHTPPDPLRSRACVEQRYELIEKNLAALRLLKLPPPSVPEENAWKRSAGADLRVLNSAACQAR